MGVWVGGATLTEGHFPLFTSKAESHAIFSANALFLTTSVTEKPEAASEIYRQMWGHLNNSAERLESPRGIPE